MWHVTVLLPEQDFPLEHIGTFCEPALARCWSGEASDLSVLDSSSDGQHLYVQAKHTIYICATSNTFHSHACVLSGLYMDAQDQGSHRCHQAQPRASAFDIAVGLHRLPARVNLPRQWQRD